MNSDYAVAVHILSLLNREAQPLSSEFIADSVGVNPVVIRQVSGLLRRGGLLATQRGVMGAKLTRPAEQISLLDVYRAVGAPQTVLKLHRHPNPACPVGANISACWTACLLRPRPRWKLSWRGSASRTWTRRCTTSRVVFLVSGVGVLLTPCPFALCSHPLPSPFTRPDLASAQAEVRSTRRVNPTPSHPVQPRRTSGVTHDWNHRSHRTFGRIDDSSLAGWRHARRRNRRPRSQP